MKLAEKTINLAFKEEHDILQYLRRKALSDNDNAEFLKLVNQIKNKK